MVWRSMAQIFTPKAMTVPDRAHVKVQSNRVVVAIATEDRAYVKFQNAGVMIAIAN